VLTADENLMYDPHLEAAICAAFFIQSGSKQ
jgi:hypothetical protein